MKPVHYNLPSPPKESLLTINSFSGVNLALSATQIDDNECSDMLNMYISKVGVLEKRFGYEKIFNSIGNIPVNGMTLYRKAFGQEYFLFVCGTKLYKLNQDYTYTEVYEGLNNNRVTFFTFNNLCYILDGVNYKVYDGTTVMDVVGYVPTLFITTPPAGGGEPHEQWNLLSNSFKQSFTADGEDKNVTSETLVDSGDHKTYKFLNKNIKNTGVKIYKNGVEVTTGFTIDYVNGIITFSTVNAATDIIKSDYTYTVGSYIYVLCLKELDVTTVLAWVNDVQKQEGTDFTVDRANGTVTFKSLIYKSIPDNVVIQAYKTTPGLADRVKKCTDYVFFGGMNDSHIILYRNPNTPSVLYRSGVVDPTYFPENYYQAVGSTTEEIMKLVIQYDICVILKERSIWHMDFQLSSTTEAVYPVRPLNDSVGCLNPYSVQLLDNTPTYLNNNGIYQITQSNVREEKNVQIISERINKLLLKDSIKCSYDFENHYILAGEKNTYVFDYLRDAWFIWDKLNAECFLEADKKLYFGDSKGTIHRFKNEDDRLPYNDNGLAIVSYWKSKAFSFKHSESNKLVQKLFVTMLPYKRSGAYFYYVTDTVIDIRNQANLPNYATFDYGKSLYNDRIFDSKSEYIDQLHFELMDYSDLDYKWFSYNADAYPPEQVMKVKAKKIPYYQFVIQNSKTDENVGIDTIVIKYYVQSYRK